MDFFFLFLQTPRTNHWFATTAQGLGLVNCWKYEKIIPRHKRYPVSVFCDSPSLKFFFSRPPIGWMSALYDNLVCREATLLPSFVAQLQWVRIESPWSGGWRGCDSVVSCLKLIDYENRRNRKRKHSLMHRFVLMLSSLRMVAGAPARCLKWRGLFWSSFDWASQWVLKTIFLCSSHMSFLFFYSLSFSFLNWVPFVIPLVGLSLFSTHWSWMYPWR